MDVWDPIVRLLVAGGLAAVIGLDRELRGKPAGLRTNIVVSVAAAGFAYTGMSVFDPDGGSRVVSTIVTGIGFLGGGAIFASGGKPHGLTTAAALWGSAAVGLAAGLWAWEIALAIVVVTVIALLPVDWLADHLTAGRKHTSRDLFFLVEDVGALNRVRAAFTDRHVDVLQLEVYAVHERMAVDLLVEGKESAIEGAFNDARVVPAVAFASQEAKASQ